jgi:FAD/FMN-containing dehydrogenase
VNKTSSGIDIPFGVYIIASPLYLIITQGIIS